MIDRDIDTHLIRLFEGLVGNEGVPVRFLRWPMISVIAGAVANRVWVKIPYGGVEYRLRPNLYTLLIAPSGSYKSFGIRVAVDLLRAAPSVEERIHLFEGGATAKGMLDQMVATKLHPQQDKMFLVQDELAADVGSQRMADDYIKALTKMYYLAPYEETTRTTGHVKLHNKYDPYGYCINLLWATTPDWLADAVPITARHGGFFPRVCTVIERGWRKPVFEPTAVVGAEKRRAFITGKLEELLRLEGEISRSPSAYEWEREWFESRPLPVTDREKAYYARERDWLEKLAMVEVLADGPRTIIEVKDYCAAAKLVKEASESPEEFLRGGNLLVELRDKLRVSPKGACRVELLRWAEGKGKLAGDLDEVLMSMKAIGEVREERTPTKGRPRVQYFYIEGEDDEPT